MTGGIAHDFNNLLAVIIMEMESLAEDFASGTVWRDSVDNALASAIRGAELVERLQTFSRSGELKPRRTEIGSLLQELRPLLTAAVPKVDLEIDVAEGLYPCMVDRAGLETAILNLAVNAREAMPEQGRLRIVARNRVIASSSPELQAGMSPGAWLHIAIVDSGAGVSRDLATSPDGSGSGLGLSMAYGLAIRSGGFVAVDSEPGGGTTIGLFLPPVPDVIALSPGAVARGLAAAA
jgi:signal transduction histidine kinase